MLIKIFIFFKEKSFFILVFGQYNIYYSSSFYTKNMYFYLHLHLVIFNDNN